MTFGTLTKSFRLLHEMSQKELGDKVGVSEDTIEAYENGSKLPEFAGAAAIANVFAANPQRFVELASPGITGVYGKSMQGHIKEIKEIIDDIFVDLGLTQIKINAEESDKEKISLYEKYHRRSLLCLERLKEVTDLI